MHILRNKGSKNIIMNILESETGKNSMDILSEFLEVEINSKEISEKILKFITSYEIRQGEYKGKKYIIYKVDREHFILYPEFNDDKLGIRIPYSLFIYLNDLVNIINDHVNG